MVNQFWEDFDNIFRNFNHRVNERLPHFDLYKDDEGKLTLEIAMAGFRKDEIDVEQASHVLIITANPAPLRKVRESVRKYLHTGLSRRPVKLQFPMDINWELKQVSFCDGILKFEIQTQEVNVPKKIAITSPLNTEESNA